LTDIGDPPKKDFDEFMIAVRAREVDKDPGSPQKAMSGREMNAEQDFEDDRLSFV
jgi:hypothetical protein